MQKQSENRLFLIIITIICAIMFSGASAACSVADLSVNKTVNDTHPYVGHNVNFTITATNNGPNDATYVMVKDTLPSGLEYVSSTASVGSYNSGTGIWYIGNLANGKSETLNIIAKNIQGLGQMTNRARISGAQYDPNRCNNKACVSVCGKLYADLAITKQVNQSSQFVGEDVNFTLTATNNGPIYAWSVTVNDLLPAGLKYVSSTASLGSYNNGTGLWDIGFLPMDAQATLNIVAKVLQTGQITNCANITGGLDDLNPTNNEACAKVCGVARTDLGITKQVNNSHPNLGDTITFTLTAINNGPQNATGVVVKDLLPAGLKFLSADPAADYNATTGIWTIGDLAVGKTAILTINALVTISNKEMENTAVISGNEYDPVLCNNTDSVTVVSNPAADMGINKTSSKSTATVGDTVNFYIKITNSGPDAAANVKVLETLPDGFSYLSSNATQGTYDPETGIWTVGGLLNGESAKLTIITQAIESGTLVNNAVVESDTFDPNSNNNAASATVNVKAEEQPNAAGSPGQESVNAATVPMQTTGAPALPLLIAALLVIGGMLKRK
ncbi:MAG TPA: DUF11 domain-containing protein [Methanobacterium sp.]|nr:DUF11 domain-containing protein [Methanobacterium sp.]